MIKIMPNIWLGNAEDVNPLNISEANITAILNVAAEIKDDYYPNVKMVKVGLVDDAIKQTMMIHIALWTLRKWHNNFERILIHCAVGFSRSPYVLARFISGLKQQPIDWAYKFIKKKCNWVDDDSPLRRAQ